MNLTNCRYILHIDDDDDDRVMLKEALLEIAPTITVRNGRNGAEGLELLFQGLFIKELPSLIFLDLNMPGMDGKQVLKEIRKKSDLSDVPVVLLTTSSSTLDKMFAAKEGVELVTKPSRQAEFTEAIRMVMEQLKAL